MQFSGNALAIVDLVESARIAAARREGGFGAPDIGRFNVKLNDGRGCISGNGCFEATVAGRRHRGAIPGAAVGRPPQRARGHSVGVADCGRNRDGLIRRGNSRSMLKLAECGADVRFEARISRAGRAVQARHVEQGPFCQTLEIQPRVQLVRAGQRFRAEGNLIRPAVHNGHTAGQRGLRVVVHVLGRTGRVETQHTARAERIRDDAGPAVVAEEAPLQRVGERTVLDQLPGRPRGTFDHAEIVQ